MNVVLTVAILAPLVTKLVDTLRNAVDTANRLPKVIWNVAAFSIGILLTFAAKANVLADVFANATLGTAITGFAIGAYASGFHEFFDFLSSRAKE